MAFTSKSLAATALLLAYSVNAQAFSLVECMATQSKQECTRQLLINDEMSKPLAAGEEIAGNSGKYTFTIRGDDWLRNGYASHPNQAKDLGLIKGSGTGMLTVDLSDLQPAEFEKTITEDMKTIFTGLSNGFRAGKIGISKHSEIEILPVTVQGGEASLGRFCYQVNLQNVKPICVYEEFVTHGKGETYKIIGTIGDYAELRSELESIITSFKFTQ